MQLWFHLQNHYNRIVDIVIQRIRREFNRRRRCVSILQWVATATVCGTITFFILFGIDFNARIIPKFDTSRPDPGTFANFNCFANFSHTSRSMHYGMIPSVPLMEDDTCYDFAGLILPIHYNLHDETAGQPNITTSPNISTTQITSMATVFHTFWSTAYSRQLTENQLSALRSFIATQQGYNHLLYFWISKKDQEALIHGNEFWNSTQQLYSDAIQLKILEEDLVTDEVLLQLRTSSNAYDVESILRVLTLYQHGGVWFDLDTLFIRDLAPLLHQEWTTQSDCHEPSNLFTRRRYKIDNRFKGSLMHFYKQSPYLCEMLNTILSFQKNSQYFNSSSKSDAVYIPNFREYLYQLVFYRVLKHKLTPWAVLPWCFTSPSQCKTANSLPTLFDQAILSEVNKRRLRRSFAHSYDRKWYRSPGTLFVELIDQHKSVTGW